MSLKGTTIQVTREKYPTVALAPLSVAGTFKTTSDFSNVLPQVKFTFYREQEQIAGFSMDDISRQDQLSNFKFTKVP